MQSGKKTKEWDNVRRYIKKQFNEWQIFRCEIRKPNLCWGEIHGFAHKKKRRKLTKEELYEVIGACNPCHNWLEKLPAEEMERVVTEIISKRHNTLF